jgi:hypothetical protein
LLALTSDQTFLFAENILKATTLTKIAIQHIPGVILRYPSKKALHINAQGFF